MPIIYIFDLNVQIVVLLLEYSVRLYVSIG